MVIMQRIS